MLCVDCFIVLNCTCSRDVWPKSLETLPLLIVTAMPPFKHKIVPDVKAFQLYHSSMEQHFLKCLAVMSGEAASLDTNAAISQTLLSEKMDRAREQDQMILEEHGAKRLQGLVNLYRNSVLHGNKLGSTLKSWGSIFWFDVPLTLGVGFLGRDGARKEPYRWPSPPKVSRQQVQNYKRCHHAVKKAPKIAEYVPVAFKSEVDSEA